MIAGTAVPPAFSYGIFTRPERSGFYPETADGSGYPLTGMSDHGVSEALYLNDPDGNGVELYWDRPGRWPIDEGKSAHGTEALDVKDLLAELDR